MLKNLLAKLLSEWLMPDYEAHKRAAQLNTSAAELHYRKEAERWKNRALKAEAQVDMFCEVTDNIVQHALNVPDDQMLLFLHQTMMEIDHAHKYV